MCCARLVTVSLEAITHLQTPGGATVRSSPGPHDASCAYGVEVREPRSGRSEAEWLDRAVDRRTTRDVMAAVHAAVAARQHSQGDRGALVEERQEARRSRPPQFRNSERARAHNQERTFPAKPDCGTRSQHGIWRARRCTRLMTTTICCVAGRTRHASGARATPSGLGPGRRRGQPSGGRSRPACR